MHHASRLVPDDISQRRCCWRDNTLGNVTHASIPMPDDHNPRPLKRQRVESVQDAQKDVSSAENLGPIPPSTLLLALPSFLIHPPTHPDHQSSLQLSSAALKKCLELPETEGDLECCAWTALAEVGIIQGIQEPGTAEEVEKAISKAVSMR